MNDCNALSTSNVGCALHSNLVGAILQNNVNVVLVLEEALESNNVLMIEISVQLNLGENLLLGATLLQGGLGNDFPRIERIGGEVSKFVNFCESALRENEITFTALALS